jgi:hypothetical protein
MNSSEGRRYFLTIKVGIESPFHARIFEVGDGLKLQTQLVSLADVEGFLEDVRPIAWVDEVRWLVPDESMTVVSRPPESLGALIERANQNLKETGGGHAEFILGDSDFEALRDHFEKWRQKPTKL